MSHLNPHLVHGVLFEVPQDVGHGFVVGDGKGFVRATVPNIAVLDMVALDVALALQSLAQEGVRCEVLEKKVWERNEE